MKYHNKPKYLIQVIENALHATYGQHPERWNKIYDFYEKRYLNPDSPYKQFLKYSFVINQHRGDE